MGSILSVIPEVITNIAMTISPDIAVQLALFLGVRLDPRLNAKVQIGNVDVFGGLMVAWVSTLAFFVIGIILWTREGGQISWPSLNFDYILFIAGLVAILILIHSVGKQICMSINENCRIVQTGFIVAFLGDRAHVPSGWVLADGSPLNPKNPEHQQLALMIGGFFDPEQRGRHYLPDLRGRFAAGACDARPLGTCGGREMVTLSINELPTHSHGFLHNSIWHRSFTGENGRERTAYNEVQADTSTVGGNQPFSIMPPFVAVN